MESITCKHCGGKMEITNKVKYSQGFGFFLILLGFISIIFGLPFGILLVAGGFYICIAKENVWLCGECKVALPRVEI